MEKRETRELKVPKGPKDQPVLLAPQVLPVLPEPTAKRAPTVKLVPRVPMARTVQLVPLVQPGRLERTAAVEHLVSSKRC